MDNNFDNTPENKEQPVVPEETAPDTPDVTAAQNSGTDTAAPESDPLPDSPQQSYTYTDPNADYVQYGNNRPDANDPQYNQQYSYGGPNANNNQNYSYGSSNGQNNQEFNYQDNYNYNTGNNTAGYHRSYDSGMDERPMTMGDWVLTILIMTLVPCVGIVLYFVWAFSKSGNLNRRNYCRAYLIISGIMLVIVIIFLIIFGIIGLGTQGMYY